MAVFDKTIQRRSQLDDTDVLTCTWESSQNIQGHTEYVIRVQQGANPDHSWCLNKRYRDFATLHGLLASSGIALSLPPKRLIGNMDPLFVAERQAGLQNYMAAILQNLILAESLPVKQFLNPKNYTFPFQESALHAVSLGLRGEPEWEIIKPLPDIGWRIRKHYFIVRQHKGDQEMLLSWVEYGPDMNLEIAKLQSVLSCLSTIETSIAVKMELVRCSETGCFIVRRFVEKGSLRDILYGVKPRMSFMKKYGCPKQAYVFRETELIQYGRQLLHILSALHEKNVPFGQLHAGNLCIENGHILLLDVEGGLLGLPNRLRHYITQHRKLDSLQRIDIYCFGHLLFELAFRHPLNSSTLEPENVHEDCSPSLAGLLSQLLSHRALRGSLPTAMELLQHNFFRTHDSEPFYRLSLRFSGANREVLKLVSSKTEERLRHDQEIIYRQRRLARVQQLLSSDEEKRRRRQKWKQKERDQREQSHQQQLAVNGKSPERSESPASTSTATSAGTLTPPSVPCDAAAMGETPTPSTTSPTSAASNSDRSALLNSICSFNKTALRQVSKNHNDLKP